MTDESLQQKMDEVLALIESDPETKAMLDMAREDGIRIFFDECLGGTGTDGVYNAEKSTLRIVPTLDAVQTAKTFAHELRHHWQYKQPGYLVPQNASPREVLLYRRVKEADAFAFESWFSLRLTSSPNNELFSDLAKDKYLAVGIMKRMFECELQWLGSYDRKSVLSAILDLGERNKAVIPEAETMAAFRKILKTGVGADDPSYVDELSDKELEALLLRDANKNVVDLIGLSEKFNAAVEKGDRKSAKNLYRLSLEKAAHIDDLEKIDKESASRRLAHLRQYFRDDTKGRWPKHRILKKLLPRRGAPKN